MVKYPSSTSLEELNARVLLKQFEVSDADLQLIRNFSESSQVDETKLIDDFYIWLGVQVWFKDFFPNGANEKVRDLQSQYWTEFLRAEVDDVYVNNRLRLGNIHAVINLPVSAYIAGINFVKNWFDTVLRDSPLEGDILRDTSIAISRMTQLDTAIVMHAYAARAQNKMQDVIDIMQSVATGDFSNQISVESKNDYLAQSVFDVVNSFKDIVRQANQIAQGDFDIEIQPRSDKDELGKALFNMTETLRNISNVAEAIAVGDFSTTAEVKGTNDKIGTAINTMIDNFKKITNQANLIAQGDFDAEVQPRSDKDTLGIALFDMTKSLHNIGTVVQAVARGDFSKKIDIKGDKDKLGIAVNDMIASLTQSAEQNQRENWLKTGLAELGNHMRGELDLPTLCKNVITYLCKYLNAQVGIFYLADVDQTLRMNASYAFTRRKGLSNEIKFGEGLVGQAALEKEAIVISDIPENYTSISSGLGESVPRHMLVVPVLQADVVMGMIEVGSFHPFTNKQIELLQLVNENIAIAIKSSQDGDKMKGLLNVAQRSSEELQKQQEELKASNEELEEQSRALKTSEEVLKAQSEELQQSNEELEEKSNFLERQKSEIENQNSAIKISRQELIVKADELELSSKYKSEFLANMSHELRTPLNSLLILSKSLADNRQGNLTDDQVESASTVHSGGQELLQLINDILDLSKVEAGKLNVHIEAIHFSELTNDLNSKFKPLTDDKGLQLDFEIEAGVPDSILSDDQRTQQILKNLLSNAIKFTRHGSVKVNIHPPASDTRFIHSELKSDTAVGMSVTDTGIGIAADKQREIFEAFQQADGSTSREYGGTGLGLTISRELAQLLGGEIMLQSEVGVGSTFTLYLPLDETVAVHNEPTSARIQPVVTRQNPKKTSSKSINSSIVSNEVTAETKFLDDDRDIINKNDKSLLIIEDDHAFAKILLQLARDKGFKCLSAGDGNSGIHLALKYNPSGVILDLGLPDIDGLAVLEQLKHNLVTRHIPVHIMSSRDARSASLNAGAIDFLKKPVTEDGIETSFMKIENILDKDVKKLLVVEDNDTNRKSIVKLLENKHIEIVDVADGQSAIDRLKEEPFDCMILDIDLPDMSGFDVLKALKKEKNIIMPPVIIHTGQDLSEEQHNELTHYADSIVIKGVASPERLLDEASLFLHSVATAMPQEQQNMIQMLHDPAHALNEKHILLVDDDLRNTFALSKELRENGMEVTLADNGELALEQLEKEKNIDLVLMDIMMPIMDGHEAMQKIRQQAQYQDLPIIALTALAMPEDRAKCIESGANDYLSKPVDVDKLLSMMRIWLFSGTQKERHNPN